MKRKIVFYSILIITILSYSCNSNNYYTIDDLKTIDKIDIHTHIHCDSSKLIDVAKKANFMLVTINTDMADTVFTIKKQFEIALRANEYSKGKVNFIATFSIDNIEKVNWLNDTKQWLDSCINSGAIAVKIWKNIGMVNRDSKDSLIMIDDNRFDPLFKWLSDKHIPVIGHLGEPKDCWLKSSEMTNYGDSVYFSSHPQYYMYLQPQMPSYEAQINARNRMLDKNPDLIFIGAHLASLEWSVDSIAEFFNRYPNSAIDLSARMGQLYYQTHDNRQKVGDFFVKYQDRLIYGTDLYINNPKKTYAEIETLALKRWTSEWKYFATADTIESSMITGKCIGLKLEKDIINKIYFKNALRYFANINFK